jgi:hypothetical protein
LLDNFKHSATSRAGDPVLSADSQFKEWGEPRVTRDIDLTVLAGIGNEERIIDPLLQKYAARIQDAREFALRRRVLLLAAPGGAGIDVLLGALPYEENLINNATPFAFGPELEIRTCSEVKQDRQSCKRWRSYEKPKAPINAILASYPR